MPQCTLSTIKKLKSINRILKIVDFQKIKSNKITLKLNVTMI
jgi:hypothetical protein